MSHNILLVHEKDDLCLDVLYNGLKGLGHKVWRSHVMTEAEQQLGEEQYDLVVVNHASHIDGLKMFNTVKEYSPSSLVMIIASVSSVFNFIKAIQTGVDEYIEKPFSMYYLASRVARCLDMLSLQKNELMSLKRLTPVNG